jgi:PLP dependent protein
MKIEERLSRIRSVIEQAATGAGRKPEDVALVAVSKTRTSNELKECIAAGQTLFGENYVQELCSKAAELQGQARWHFIGHLQSNKVKHIAGLTEMIHSVDRLSLAEEINRQWGRINSVCDILIQVNIAEEATKSGTTAEDALQLVRAVSQLPNIRIRGLMTMPPFFDDPEGARPFFSALRHLSLQIAAETIPGVEMTELSMGMSGDFEVAIQEGATLVRVGTAIFGERS